MAVYVDDMKAPFVRGKRRMLMSHMVADTEEELYEMAKAIGLQRKWVQFPKGGKGFIHFDICQEKRALAVLAGARELTHRQLAEKIYVWRKETRAAVERELLEGIG
jgi:hypothetical protein